MTKLNMQLERRESVMHNHEEAKHLKAKWNLIHKFGVTKKAQKNNAHSADLSKKNSLDKLSRCRPVL